jgi:hypothetical protein
LGLNIKSKRKLRTMVRRRSNRIPVEFEAELTSNGIRYEVVIENLSEDCIYIGPFPKKTTVDFPTGTTLELEFQLPSGETLNLHCKVIWSNKTTPNGLTNNLALEIIEIPLTYEEFFKTLFINTMGIF